MRKTPILMYHKIAEVDPLSTLKGHFVAPALFSRHLRLLSLLGYASVPLTDWNAPTGPKKPAILTFDDGYRDFVTEAVPLMAKFGMTGTVFMVSNQLGGSNQWDVSDGDVQLPLMTPGEAKQAVAAGHLVGSHTADHVHLDRIDPAAAQLQISESKERLESEVGTKIETFCYPYGGMNADVQRWVAEAGYLCACSTDKGLAHSTSNPFALPRINVRRDTSVPILLYKLLREHRRG